MIATGGFGRVFKITSNAMAGTGDGVAIPYRRGVPLMDMEFYQFHPTGLYKLGILLSEAARGEGGILRNSDRRSIRGPLCADSERPRPARHGLPIHLSRKSRRAAASTARIMSMLDLTHLPPEVIDEKLPDVTDFARTYLRVEPKTRARADSTHRALRDGWTSDRCRRPGHSQMQSGAVIPGFYCRRRIRLRFRARRESSRHEFAGRSRRLRPPSRAADARICPRNQPSRHCPTEPDKPARAEIAEIVARPKGEMLLISAAACRKS